MVQERTIRAHLLALRALLAGAHERCETLLSDIRDGKLDPAGVNEELHHLCEQITSLAKQCERLEGQIGEASE